MDVYFDNSASTKVSEKAIEIMLKTMRDDYANTSGKHIKGVEAESYVKDAADIIAKTLKVKKGEIIFTSGGTESNNMALIGGAMSRKRYGKHIIISGIEHPAVYRPAEFLTEQGFELSVLPVNSEGQVDLELLKSTLRDDTVLVSVMYVNNEIGAIEPVEEISRIIKAKNKDILFHVDAIQAYTKLRINPKSQGIDMLSASGHKFHGPKGVGFLYIDSNVKINPIILGGGHQRGMRSGTLNTTGIAGMGVAAKEAYENFDERINKISDLKYYLMDELEKLEGAVLNTGRGENFAPQVISVSFEDIRAEVLLHALEDRGIYVSSGSACSSNHPGISGTLKAIGIRDDLLDATIRISLSELNNKEEADYFIKNLKELLPLLRKFVRK
ncbi:cysteine desulfurase family protein [Lachnoanaerobaculum sp. JCM 36186]|uniref:cysteine desulfurase family protein n=1 Tax=Lachnoanaerobaculum sanguinis TaxID=3065809 RepID=UPI00276417D9|nr:cysteine desulfurase family protein [Lachnoanaerobaculum sp. JCM 36186]GMO02359.1 cysteine desulfurase family protein [Lachnoanaerobaculum sp. JCM 36186]